MAHVAPTVPPAVYETTCRALQLSPCSRTLDWLHTIHDKSTIFSARKVTSDAQAVALCAALLSAHGATWSLICHYVTTFHPQMRPLHLPDSIFALLPEPTYPHHEHYAPDIAQPSDAAAFVVVVDFSCSTALTPKGAAAILIACLQLPSRIHVEVDLRVCPLVSTLPLEMWHPFLDTYPTARAHVTGLLLDACPLTCLPSCLLRRLPNLRWISMRWSKLRNLWRLAEIVNSLPSLTAALFAGDCRMDSLLHSMKESCRLQIGNDVAVSAHDKAIEMFNICVDDVRKTHENGRNANAPVVASDIISGDNSIAVDNGESDGEADYERMGLSANAEHNSSTPVTLLQNYWAFVLASRATNLCWLDGLRITPEERERARSSIRGKYELDYIEDNTTDRKVQPSLMALLRSRESGVCLHAATRGNETRGKGKTEPTRTNRPRKRTRFGDVVDETIDSTVTRRFPNPGREIALDDDAHLTIALAAVEARGETDGVGLHRGSSSSASGVVQKLEDNIGTMTQRTGIEFEERIFERQISEALVGRSGVPRIGYFKQGFDRPRQFEYNPAKSSEIVYGTALGNLVVMDEESGVVKGSCVVGGGVGNRQRGQVIERAGNLQDINWTNVEPLPERVGPEVLGLSWLNKRNDTFISGSNAGAIHVYNSEWMSSGRNGGCMYACETFDKLTSVHVCADDARFAVSGEMPHVGIFDTSSGRLIEPMMHCHLDAINVIKFAYHNPFVLLTSSFDRCVKKWDLREHRPGGRRRPIFNVHSSTDTVMACFSPDDECVLVSAVDNEVRQYSGCDGRLQLEFDMPRTGSRYNFTRSYYMNGRDYIISGSCMENVVRVYNAKSGKCLTHVDVGDNVFVQSLRANPSRRFTFSALLVGNHGEGGATGGGGPQGEMIANVDLHSRC